VNNLYGVLQSYNYAMISFSDTIVIANVLVDARLVQMVFVLYNIC
jgi:hypothetical protein